MDTVLLKNIRLADAKADSKAISILIMNGKIAETFKEDKNFAGATMLDLEGMRMLPGFIDVHNHGAINVDVNEADTEGLLEVAAFLAKNGVTGWLPTLVPDSDENYRRVIGAIDKLIEIQSDRPVAQALGVHYEGVFASEKMCGALRPEYFKTFSGREIDELPRLKKGVSMTTIAPEVGGGIALVGELTRQGWVVSIGHTRADNATLDKAFAAGTRHMTHFFNAMTGVHHREIGVAGWGLTNKDVTFDIIADGIHVHPKMLEFACRSKSPEKVSLISDSVAPTGLGDGSYHLWGETITVENGRTRNERGRIAGSVITMMDAVRQMKTLGFPDADISKMASANPARLLGLDNTLGTIDIGKRADLVGLDEKGELKFTMVGGQIVK
jgi:N-acetylglucosamine-6-phosphate deacetylase